MKKKIINGILMAAMLFAGTTSFVSCKDNVDDAIAGVYKNLDAVKADLQSQIDGLSGRVSSLEQRMSDAEGRLTSLEGRVKTLEDEVTQIQKDIVALNSRVGDLEEEQAKLKERMNVAEAKIAELEDIVKNTIYGVKVEETIDAVIGTINLPFLKVPTLMGYYGLNVSDLTQFPTTKNDLHVYYEGEDVAANPNGQYASQISPFIDKSLTRPIQFEGVGAQLAQYTNNVGTIYFSLNPVGVDLTGVTFDIVDNFGNVYPYELGEVKKSTHVLTYALGKHGEDPWTGEAVEGTDYLYEAKVHLPMAKWETAISYNLDDTWKNLQSISEVTEIIEKVRDAKNEEGKTAASKVLIKEALQWIQNQYQKTYADKYKMKYQALRATGQYNTVVSPYNLSVAAVEPLSYKTFWELDRNARAIIKANIDIDALEKGLAALAKVIVKQLPKVNLSDITIASASIDAGGANAYFVVTDGTGTWPANLGVTTDQNVDTYAISNLVAAINSANTDIQTYVNNYIHKLNNAVATVTNPNPETLVTKANNFLNKVAAKLVNITGDRLFSNAVTPIILFEGAEGIDRLSPGLTLDILNNVMTVILTSPTEEYLVPAMYKYVAVRYQDQIVDAKLLSGQEKVTSLNLHQGECEIIYQTVDYAGYVVTKSYPVTVK